MAIFCLFSQLGTLGVGLLPFDLLLRRPPRHTRNAALFPAAGPAFGDDGDLHIAGVPHDSVDQVAPDKPLPGGILGTHHEDLGDVTKPGEIEQSYGDVLALQDPGFNVQVAREIEVALHGLPFGWWEAY